MYFKTTAASFAVLMACVSALPASEVPGKVQEQVVMVAFTDPNFGGNRAGFGVTAQTQCYQLDKTDFNNVISSIQVPSGFRCRLWDSLHCNGDSTPDIYAPGAAQLPQNLDNKASSFKCYRN